jgi:hypothetical protein
MKLTGLVIIAIVVVVILIVGGTYAYIAFYRNAAPKYMNAQHEVFKVSQSYIDGKIQIISKARREYEETEDEKDRAALRKFILTESETVDLTKCPADMQSFVLSLKGGF